MPRRDALTVLLDTRRDITLDAVRRVAWGGEGVRISDGALERIGAARAAFMDMLDNDPDAFVYGVSSGYGLMAKHKLDAAARRAHANRPPSSLAAFGEALPARVTRALVLARLANFIEGHAAVTPALATAVAEMLNGRELPAVPWEGQGGAGEILSMGPLFYELGRGFPLAEKESLSLINGSPSSAALVADAALIAPRRLALAYRVMALSIEAFRAPVDAYDPVFDELWGEPSEAVALRELRRLLHGARGDRRFYQAPVSYRILPRLFGLAERCVADAARAAEVSLSSVTDNPVFIAPTKAHPRGRALSNGGYHNTMAWPALDGLAHVWAELCLVADRHTSKLHEGAVSLLPDRLADPRHPGIFTGILGMVQVGYGEAARHAAQRTFTPQTEGGGYAQNDMAPPTFPAWDKERRSGRCLDGCLAMLAIVASRALELTDRPATPALVEFLAEVRQVFPPLVDLRPFGADIGALADAFTAVATGEAGFGLPAMAG